MNARTNRRVTTQHITATPIGTNGQTYPNGQTYSVSLWRYTNGAIDGMTHMVIRGGKYGPTHKTRTVW